MYKKEDLITGRLPVLKPQIFSDIRSDYFNSQQEDCATIKNDIFIEEIDKHFRSQTQNDLTGFDSFPQKDLIMGCQHYIDNLILKHGINGLQIFEHDYHYYKKIFPGISYITLDELSNDKPLLMAVPFPGHLGKHRQFEEIMKKCNREKIDVHLDCAWMVCAFDIRLNFDQPCIKSFAMSFSKAYGLHWNKIGLRWSRKKDESDSVTFLNDADAIPKTLLSVAKFYMNRLPIDYLCKKYKESYFDICKNLKLRPANVIHACFSIDRKILYGLSRYFD